MKFQVGDILEIKATEYSRPFHLLILAFYGYSPKFEEYTVIHLEDGVTTNTRFWTTDNIIVRVVA
jgi:hypothetical protein